MLEKRGRQLHQSPDMVPVMDIKGDRICHLIGVFGETGVGKSFQTKREIDMYTKSIPGKKNARKVLLFDTNGEYLEYPHISLENVKNFTKPMCLRINAKGWTIDQKRRGAMYCANEFKNGLLIIDDLDKITPFSKDEELIGLMMGGRHAGDDLMVTHQSLDMGTSFFYRNALSIRLHNQLSNTEALRGKAEKYLPILKIAENIVNKQYELGNDRFFVTINLRKRKIFGCSDKGMFQNAVKRYLMQHPKIIREALNELMGSAVIKNSQRSTDESHDKALAYAIKKLDPFYGTGPFHA